MQLPLHRADHHERRDQQLAAPHRRRPALHAVSRKGLLTIGAGYAGGFFRTNPQLATPDVQVHFIIFSADAAGAALHPFSGLHRLGLPVAAGEPRLRAHQIGRSGAAAGDPAALPVEPQSTATPIVAGMKLLRADHGPAGDAPLHRRGARARRAAARATTICSPSRGRPARRSSTRPAPAAWARTPTAVVDERLRVRGFERLARDRRLDHADGRIRQHQRRRRDDRRKRRRHDLAGCCGARADYGRRGGSRVRFLAANSSR